MINPALDLAGALEEFETTLTLPGGHVIPCLKSFSTEVQSLGGDTAVAGTTITVRIYAADVGALQEGQQVMLDASSRKVLEMQRVAGGTFLRLVLGGFV